MCLSGSAWLGTARRSSAQLAATQPGRVPGTAQQARMGAPARNRRAWPSPSAGDDAPLDLPAATRDGWTFTYPTTDDDAAEVEARVAKAVSLHQRNRHVTLVVHLSRRRGHRHRHRHHRGVGAGGQPAADRHRRADPRLVRTTLVRMDSAAGGPHVGLGVLVVGLAFLDGGDEAGTDLRIPRRRFLPVRSRNQRSTSSCLWVA